MMRPCHREFTISAGLSVSIDMAFHVVRPLTKRRSPAALRDVEYDWVSEPEAGKRAM